jgi:hypothetical protein
LLRIFLDKYALGNRILYGPETVDDPNNTDPNAPKIPFADVIRPQLQALESGGWLIVSNKRQQDATGKDIGPVIDIKSDESAPQNAQPILEIISEQDNWQLLSVGIPPKTVTEGSEVGSFAMVAQQRIVLLSVQEEIFTQIKEQFQVGVVDPMVAMNGCSPVTMEFTPITERPDDLASEIVKAWLTNPQLSEIVASGTVDVIAMLEACGVPVTQEGHERLTKLITRLANPPEPPPSPFNPDGSAKPPEQVEAEQAERNAQKPGEPKPNTEEKPKPPFQLSSPFLASLWPAGES